MRKTLYMFLIIVVIISMITMMSGCTEDDMTMVSTKNDFVKVNSYALDVNNDVFIYYDVNTKVMYQFIDGYKTGASIELYNSDGTIATYDENDNQNGRIKVISQTDLDVNNTIYKYYDTITKVMYQYIDGYQSCGITVMRNPDGTIATYTE